jgi:hypothetical protein
MRLIENEIRRMMTEQFEHLEDLWEQTPYNEVLAYAITIKEFMNYHHIQQIENGIQLFKSFKEKQMQQLSLLGLAMELPLSRPTFSSSSSTRLSPQTA